MLSLFHIEAHNLQKHLAQKGHSLTNAECLEAIAASKGYSSFKQAQRKLRLTTSYSWKTKLSKRAIALIKRSPQGTLFNGIWTAKFSLEDVSSIPQAITRLYQIANTFAKWQQQDATLESNIDGHLLFSTTNKKLAIEEGWDRADGS